MEKGKGEATGSGATVSLPCVSRQPADNSSTTTVALVLLLLNYHHQHRRFYRIRRLSRPRVYPYVVAEVIACLSARLNYVSACPAAGGKFRPPFCGAQHNVPRIFFFNDGNLTAVASTETCLSMNYRLCFDEQKALAVLSSMSGFNIKYIYAIINFDYFD